MTILAQPATRPQITAAELDAKERAITRSYHAAQAATWHVGDQVLHREPRKGGMVRYLRGRIVKVTATRITIEYNLLDRNKQVAGTATKVCLPTTLARVVTGEAN